MDSPSADDRGPWRAARGFGELCELGARFLEGCSVGFPGWGAEEVDEETLPLVPLLAAANRAGFLTVASQPGAPGRAGADGRLELRRAFVCGFASRGMEQTLRDLAREPGLLLGSQGEAETPLGLRGGETFLALGPGAASAELEIFADHLCTQALGALRQARWVALIDTEWGRDDRLWPALARALGVPYS